MAVVAESTTFSLEEMKTLFGRTENLKEHLFELDGSVTFVYLEEAADKFTISIGGAKYIMTESAAHQAFRAAKIPTSMIDSYDVGILTPLLNWWYSNAGGELKALTKDKVVLAFTRPGTEIYSTLSILNEITRVLKDHDIEETSVRFDKVHHDLDETQFSMFIPNKTRELEDGDVLRSGINFQHSILGQKATILAAYTSRSHADNGMISAAVFDAPNRE